MKYRSESPEATESLGAQIGALMRQGDVIALIGDLGTGKTCLTHGIAQGLGLKPGQSVNSPSYVLINEYEARHTIYHIDLYRIQHLSALADIGIEEFLFSDGVCVIEWADRILEWLPAEHWRVHLEWIDDDTRDITLTPVGNQTSQRFQQRYRTDSDENPCG